jgi:hypothetical protein
MFGSVLRNNRARRNISGTQEVISFVFYTISSLQALASSAYRTNSAVGQEGEKLLAMT